MQANRSRDTSPEVALRKELHRRGIRYRVHYRPVSGLRCEADIAFPVQRVAVFVDGCFWHSCPEHGSLPKANREWWQQKLARTVERDAVNAQSLLEAGWQVIRVWEHEDVEEAAGAIEASLLSSRRQKSL